jgi:hypothetical protein
MTDKVEISTSALILRGWLTVFIPVSIIILGIWYGLWTILNLNYTISVLIGTLTGWYYWAYSIKKWINWAIDKNVNHKRILRVGRIGLLLWKKQTITDSFENE